MTDKDILHQLADECGGIFRTSDLTAPGYNTYAIWKLVDAQIIERIRQGYYSLYKNVPKLLEYAEKRSVLKKENLVLEDGFFVYAPTNFRGQKKTEIMGCEMI